MAYSVFDNQYYVKTSTPKQQVQLPTGQQMAQNLQTVPTQGGSIAQSSEGSTANFGNIANAGAAGLSGYANAVANTDNYSIDNAAAVTGSVSGLASGGWVGAVTGGIGAAVGTTSEVSKNLDNLNTSVQGVTYSPDGTPIYQGGAILQANNQIKAITEGQKAAEQEHIGVTRVANFLYGNEDKLRRKKAELQQNIQLTQREFNRRNVGYQEQQLARKSYNDQLRNVWGVPMNYY